MDANVITEQQARAVLDAVRAQFRMYLEPMDMGDGTVEPPMSPEPTLIMDYDGRPAIAWEEGPAEWAYLVNSGGVSEETHVLFGQASEEFGVDLRPTPIPAAKLPADVYVEAIMSFVLGIYPA